MNDANRILLLDEDQSLTDLFASSLAMAGYEVRVVNDASDAVADAVEFQPDLLLLDWASLGVDATGILTGLRQSAETARTRVAFFSGKCIPLNELDQLTWFIARPMSLPAFLAAVDYVLTCAPRRSRSEESLAA